MRYTALCLCVLLWGSIANAMLCERALTGTFTADKVREYELCALQENNDAVQAFLGQVYLNAEYGVSKNVQKALLFYHLSAENGNAKSQVALAKLLLKMDEADNTRAQIQDYLDKIKFSMQSDKNASFDGDILHPYALFMLAAESANQKWYYVSDVLSAPEAGGLLKNYQLDKGKKTQMQRLASRWKERKMFDAAKEVYSEADFKKFENAVRPKSGRADAFVRTQAIEKLKQDIKKYKEQ